MSRREWKMHYARDARSWTRGLCGVVMWLGFGTRERDRVTCQNCLKKLRSTP